MKKAIFLGLIVSFGVFLGVGNAQAWEGTNTVAVDNCVQVSNGVNITRFGSTYTLTNGVRNAGHGYRNYNLTCVSSKMYKVEWNNANAPAPVPALVLDTTKPVATLSVINKNTSGNQLYSANMQVRGTDASSAVNKIEVFISGAGYVGWYKTFSWVEIGSAKDVTKNFEIRNLKYNTTYSLYANVYDSAGNMQTVYLNNLTQNLTTQDTDYPTAILKITDKDFNANNYDLTMQVNGNDTTSPVTQIEVYGYGYNGTGWTKEFEWKDDNATSKNVTKTFSIGNLLYNTFYNFYAVIFDKSGKSTTINLADVKELDTPKTCDTTANFDAVYALCPNQTLLHNPSNTLLKNVYVGSNSLILQVNANKFNHIYFSTFGEEKTIPGLGGMNAIKVKFNGYNNQGTAFVEITQL